MEIAHTVRARRGFDVAAVVLFSALLAAPTIDRCVRPDEARGPRRENREAAPRPTTPTSVAEFFAWPTRFDDWYADTNGLRDYLLGARNHVLVDAHVSPTDLLDVGPNGWIAYRGDSSRDSHRGTFRWTREAVDLWIADLARRTERMRERGARFVFAVVPDKETIYPDESPSTWAPLGPSVADVFFAECARRPDLDVIDLRPALRAARAEDRPEAEDHAYYPRGTHWTSRGACAGSRVVAERLGAWFPGVVPLDCGALVREPVGGENEDSWMHNLYAPWRLVPTHVLVQAGGWDVPPSLPPSEIGTTTIVGSGLATQPFVYFVHDSHGTFVQPFLAQACRRLRASWRTSIDELVVDLERPDVVLMIRAERMLSVPPTPDLETTAGRARASIASVEPVWSVERDFERARTLGHGRFDRIASGLTWTSRERGDRFVVEVQKPADPRARFAVSYEIDSTVASRVDLWLAVEGANQLPWNANVPGNLAAGRNVECVVLEALEPTGRVLVRFGPAGTWTLRRFDVHVLPPEPANE